MIRDELLAALPHLRRLPDRIDRILTLAGRGELRIRSVVDEDGQRILRTLVNRALLVHDRRGRSCSWRRCCSSRRRRGRWWRAGPACSRSSATAACSPAPCSCCAWWPRSPGTGRHEPRPVDPEHRPTPPPPSRPPTGFDRRRRASATTAIRATSCGWSLWGAARSCWPSSSRSATATSDGVTADLGGSARVPDFDPRAAARADAGRRASPCRPSSWSGSSDSDGGAGSASSCWPRSRAPCSSRCSTRGSTCRRRPGCGHERHLGAVDAVPLARLPRGAWPRPRRSASRGSRGRGAGRRRRASSCSACVMALAGQRRRARAAARGRGRRRGGAALLVVFGAPNRRPAPATVACALADGGSTWPASRSSGAEGGRSQLYVADAPTATAVFVKVYARDSRDADLLYRGYRTLLLRGPNDELAVTVARARRRARGLAAAARAAGRRDVPAGGRAPRSPTVRSCSALAYVDGARLDELAPERSTTNSSTRCGARSRRCTRLAWPTARCAPRNILVAADGPVVIDLGFGKESATPRLQAIDRAELLASLAALVGAERAVASAAGCSTPTTSAAAAPVPPAARAVGRDPQAGVEVAAGRAPRRDRRPRPARSRRRSSPSSGSGRGRCS